MDKIKELSSKQLILNALHGYQINAIYHERTLNPEPLSLEQESGRSFWGYLISVMNILEKSKQLKSYTTRDSLQNVVWNDTLWLRKKGSKISIDDTIDINEINWHLLDSHKKEIYDACETAYKDRFLRDRMQESIQKGI